MQIFVVVKHCFVFGIKYVKYVYYGLKQRIIGLFNLDLNIFGFIKSLFRLPFESWFFAKMEMSHGY